MQFVSRTRDLAGISTRSAANLTHRTEIGTVNVAVLKGNVAIEKQCLQ